MIRRNYAHVMSTGRYVIDVGGQRTWSFTLWGARRAERRLRRIADGHGRVVT